LTSRLHLPTPLPSTRLWLPRVSVACDPTRRTLFVFSVCRLVSRRCHKIGSIGRIAHHQRYYEGSDSRGSSPRLRGSPHLLRLAFPSFRLQPRDAPDHRFSRHGSVTDGSQASPFSRRLAATSRRIEFVLLRTDVPPPVALHPASRRRSYSWLRSVWRAPRRTLTVLTRRPRGRTTKRLRRGVQPLALWRPWW